MDLVRRGRSECLKCLYPFCFYLVVLFLILNNDRQLLINKHTSLAAPAPAPAPASELVGLKVAPAVGLRLRLRILVKTPLKQQQQQQPNSIDITE